MLIQQLENTVQRTPIVTFVAVPAPKLLLYPFSNIANSSPVPQFKILQNYKTNHFYSF